MLRVANLLTIFFLSLWTYFCFHAFYVSYFGALQEFKEFGLYLGVFGTMQLGFICYNLIEIWKEKIHE